jgi:spore coat protein D
MYFGTNVTPPIIHPTTNIVNNTFSSTVVPHIHPIHATTINHHMYQHKHYCTETASCCEQPCHQHIDCCPGPMPFGPGFGAGPMMGPGYGAGPMMGPGAMGPGAMGPGAMGPGAMGPGAMGPGPMGPGPMGPGYY